MHAVHVQANSPAGGWRCSCPPGLCSHWQKKPWRGSSVAGDAEHSIALHFWSVSLEHNRHCLEAHVKATLFDTKSCTCFAWRAHRRMTTTCSCYVPETLPAQAVPTSPATPCSIYVCCYLACKAKVCIDMLCALHACSSFCFATNVGSRYIRFAGMLCI